jgi:hypothetical protein
MSVVDLVRDFLQVGVAEAARWLDEHFDVPQIPKHRHLEPNQPLRWCDVGHEQPIELLVKSGIWAMLCAQAQRIAPVLLTLGSKQDHQTFRVRISNRALMRYGGAKSFSSVGKAIGQLEEIGWLKTMPDDPSHGAVVRNTNTYILTPFSDSLMELAQATLRQMRMDVEAERELRKCQRRARAEALKAATRLVEMKPT